MLNVTNFLISKIIAEREGLTSNDATRLAMTGAVLPGAAKQVLMTQQMAKTAVAAQPETIRAEVGVAVKDELPTVVDKEIKTQVNSAYIAELIRKEGEDETTITGALQTKGFNKVRQPSVDANAVQEIIADIAKEPDHINVEGWVHLLEAVLSKAAENSDLKEKLGQALNANLSPTSTSPATKK